MPFYSCPNCGSSISDAVGASPSACPWCCAKIRVEDDVPAAARLRAQRPRPVLRMPLGMDPLAPWAARHAIEALRHELGDARYRVCELLVSELVNNVVRHTDDGSRITASDMRVRVYPDRVRIEVRDQGPGFNPSMPGTGGEDRESGWGLLLVEELADEWGVESGVQNCVWFELPRTPLASGLHAAPHH